jgi:CDP-diacylglycerol--serine O-phosphatidyltransferase
MVALSREEVMKLRKLMFVLPNLFTLSSIFCGFYAITLCAGEASPSQLYQAALAIFFAIFFDGFDGRVARLTKTQTQFGIELDSLADVISFGVAPAMLVYKWALLPLGFFGMFISFAFASCLLSGCREGGLPPSSWGCPPRLRRERSSRW